MTLLGLTNEAANYCALFEVFSLRKDASLACIIIEISFQVIDNTFERKIAPREALHSIYTSNYSSAASSCIVLRRWTFNVATERQLCKLDPVFQKLCFYQAINDVNSGAIQVKERLYQLKAWQTEDRCNEVRFLRAHHLKK